MMGRDSALYTPKQNQQGNNAVGFAWSTRVGAEVRLQVLPPQRYQLAPLKCWCLYSVISKVINNKEAGLASETRKMLVGKKKKSTWIHVEQIHRLNPGAAKRHLINITIVSHQPQFQKTNSLSILYFMELKVTIKPHHYLSLPLQKKIPPDSDTLLS